jgi:hypothetical protein
MLAEHLSWSWHRSCDLDPVGWEDQSCSHGIISCGEDQVPAVATMIHFFNGPLSSRWAVLFNLPST